MTLEQVINELKFLSLRNKSIEALLELEKRNKKRYDYLVSIGRTDEAEKLANKTLEWKIGEQIQGIVDIEAKYKDAIQRLPEPDKTIAVLRFIKGLKTKEIAARLHYKEDAIKKRLYGRKEKTYSYSSIYEQIYKIIKGEG
jgi:DNA-directed RNA polymerase specialized sigma24 family protein